MKNMVSDNVWSQNYIRSKAVDNTQQKYNPAKELRIVKHNAQDAIAELLEMLPEDDMRCGMVRVLGKWLDNEIDTMPDDMFCEEVDD